jgi:large subunit ribosomal protein L6
MSRVAKSPIPILDGVNVELLDNVVNVKGKLGELSFELPESISIEIEDSTISVKYNEDIQSSVALGGTTRSLINNMILGVTSGFEKKLELKGVGYRAKASGKLLELTLGFSHPVKYQLPEEVNVETPSQTEIILIGLGFPQNGMVSLCGMRRSWTRRGLRLRLRCYPQPLPP